MPAEFEPIWVFFSAFGIAAFGGTAAHLRSKEQITLRSITVAFLFSGIVGLLICLALYNYFDAKDNIFLLLAISGLTGIGGANVVDLTMLLLGGKLKLVLHAEAMPDVKREEAPSPPEDKEIKTTKSRRKRSKEDKK